MGTVESEDDVIPVWGRIWVLPDDITETDPDLKRAKNFGFELPDQRSEREQLSQTEGKLVAVGGNAFENWKEPIPKAGDRILFDKYAGAIKKINGVTYRLIDDTDVVAIIRKNEEDNNG